MPKFMVAFKDGKLVQALPEEHKFTRADKKKFTIEKMSFLNEEDVVTSETNGKKYIIDPETNNIAAADEFAERPKYLLIDKIKAAILAKRED